MKLENIWADANKTTSGAAGGFSHALELSPTIQFLATAHAILSAML